MITFKIACYTKKEVQLCIEMLEEMKSKITPYYSELKTLADDIDLTLNWFYEEVKKNYPHCRFKN